MTAAEIRALPKDAMKKVTSELAKAFLKGEVNNPKTLFQAASAIVDAQLALLAEIAAAFAEQNELTRAQSASDEDCRLWPPQQAWKIVNHVDDQMLNGLVAAGWIIHGLYRTEENWHAVCLRRREPSKQEGK